MTKQRILVVADDIGLRATLARCLIAKGYSVEVVKSTKYAGEVLTNEESSAAIVAPDRLGGDFERKLRAVVERLNLLAASATSSVSALSTIASEPVETAPELLRFAGYTLDPAGRRCLDTTGSAVALTRAEFSLLLSLVRRSGRVVSRDELTRAAAGRGVEPGDRSVDVLISRLRRKIEADAKSPQMILTVPGVGYLFAATSRHPPPDVPVIITTAEGPTTNAAAARFAGGTEPAATASTAPLPRFPIRDKASASVAQLAMRLSRTLRPKGPSRLPHMWP